jgi:hypothetical protein
MKSGIKSCFITTLFSIYTVNGLDSNFSIKHNSLKVRYLCLIKMSRL